MKDDSQQFPDWDMIHSYTRSQAIDDGVLIDVSNVAREAGVRYPVAVTHALWHQLIVPDEKGKGLGQSEAGRLWDVISMLRLAAKQTDGQQMLFPVIFLMNGKHETHQIKAVCGPGDNEEPVITLMLPEED